ncbi:MAG: hypothetical protein JWM82_3737, partial [Myxococcales bacterium]|nr:hypothetical protein [Myxococcales bacterium]
MSPLRPLAPGYHHPARPLIAEQQGAMQKQPEEVLL